MDDTQTAIESLRTDLRKQKRMTIAAALVAALALLFGGIGRNQVSADEDKPPQLDDKTQYELLQAKRFELVDKNGGVIAALKSHEESGRPILALYGAKGHPRAFLALNQDGHPLLSFQDDEPRQRLRLYLNYDDFAGQLDMFDQKGIAALELQAGVNPYMVMRNGEKEPRVILASNEPGPILGLKGKNENEVRIGIDDDESPMMQIWDKEAKLLFKQPK